MKDSFKERVVSDRKVHQLDRKGKFVFRFLGDALRIAAKRDHAPVRIVFQQGKKHIAFVSFHGDRIHKPRLVKLREYFQQHVRIRAVNTDRLFRDALYHVDQPAKSVVLQFRRGSRAHIQIIGSRRFLALYQIHDPCFIPVRDGRRHARNRSVNLFPNNDHDAYLL